MITLDSALADCQSSTSDTTTSSQSRLIEWLNRGYSSVLAQFGKAGIKKTVNTNTNVPSNPMKFTDRSYLLPPDYLFLKTVKILIGSRYYDLIEEESQEMWDYRTQYVWGGIPATFFVSDNFGFSSSELQIDPICATTTVATGSILTPTSGSMTSTTLSLTFASMPWAQNQTVTLAGFVMSSGQSISGNFVIQTVVSHTITLTIPSGVTSTITTMGTVGTTQGVPMTITYEAQDIALDHIGVTANPLYSFQTGTTANVTFTNNSTTVTSNNAIFSGWMALGSTYITPGDDGDGNYYKITAINSSTSATIQQVYQATTVTSSTYWSINQIMNLHNDMVDLPNYYALWKYYLFKKDAKWKDYYKTMFYQELNLAKGNWSTKTRSSIIRSKQGVSRWHTYPGWFPASGVTS
jgi:hypothetical protein